MPPKPPRPIASNELILRPPDRERESDELIDLISRTFSGNIDYWQRDTWCRDGYLLRSHYDWNASMVGVLDNQIVTHYGVWDYLMRIAQAHVRVAGIGVVLTHARYRNRGLMARTAQACLNRLPRFGYDLTVLFGISEFYNKLGYRRAFPAHRYRVETRHLPEGSKISTRRCPAVHRDDFAVVYNRAHEGLTGTAVRPTFFHGRGNYVVQPQGVWWGERGAARGFVFYLVEGDVLNLADYAGETQEVLAVTRRLAERNQCRKVLIERPHPRSDLATTLRRGECAVEYYYQAEGGPMARIVNLRSTLEKVTPVLEERLAASSDAGWEGRLLLDAVRESATLEIRRGKITVTAPAREPHAIRAGEGMVSLLLGTAPPAETVARENIIVEGDGEKLLPILFPHEDPSLAVWDSF